MVIVLGSDRNRPLIYSKRIVSRQVNRTLRKKSGRSNRPPFDFILFLSAKRSYTAADSAPCKDIYVNYTAEEDSDWN
jgi:hypothetical protein